MLLIIRYIHIEINIWWRLLAPQSIYLREKNVVRQAADMFHTVHFMVTEIVISLTFIFLFVSAMSSLFNVFCFQASIADWTMTYCPETLSLPHIYWGAGAFRSYNNLNQRFWMTRFCSLWQMKSNTGSYRDEPSKRPEITPQFLEWDKPISLQIGWYLSYPIKFCHLGVKALLAVRLSFVQNANQLLYSKCNSMVISYLVDCYLCHCYANPSQFCTRCLKAFSCTESISLPCTVALFCLY